MMKSEEIWRDGVVIKRSMTGASWRGGDLLFWAGEWWTWNKDKNHWRPVKEILGELGDKLNGRH